MAPSPITLDHLNPEQKEAVLHKDGPLLVLAGAGSGKTRVATFRIAHLIQEGVPPSQILGLTFTNKAAGEMNERVQKATSCRVLISTFHSLGARILRESIDHLGYETSFSIYDEEDVLKLLSSIVDKSMIEKKGDLKSLRIAISKAKNENGDLKAVDTSSLNYPLRRAFDDIFVTYTGRMKESNALDFDDLLYLTVRLFSEHPEVLEKYQDRWHYLLIDEYQDTNHAQYELVRLLAQKRKNLFVVGDPDQSIYSWRGAAISNILNFESDYADAKVIKLEQNYRSTSNILEAANALILKNESRYPKDLWSDLGEGEKPRLFIADNEEEEAYFIVDKINDYIGQGVPLNEIAIFYRTNAQSRAFEDLLLYNDIPYTIVGGISFYQRREIKDVLSFLRMCQTGADWVAFQRSLNLPRRGIRQTTLEKIQMATAELQIPVYELVQAIVNEEPLNVAIKLTARQKKGLKEYVETIQKLKRVYHEQGLLELTREAVYSTGYLSVLKADETTYEERFENVNELIAKASEWQESQEDHSLSTFLSEIALKASIDQADDLDSRINMMTLHNGKGLEFDLVFLAGLEEDLFPHINSRGSLDNIEEERRLCYVGMTRAKKHLFISSAKRRFMWGTYRDMRPSRFLKELPRDLIKRI